MTRKKVSSLSKEELVDEVMNLQHQVSLLQKMMFGPRSERFKVTEVPSNQLSLDVATEPVAQAQIKKTTVKEHDRSRIKLKVKKHPGRTPLPAHLRREEIIIEPQEDVTQYPGRRTGHVQKLQSGDGGRL